MYASEFLLWLTLNFPDLCISVYIRTWYGGMAPACPWGVGVLVFYHRQNYDKNDIAN